MFALTPAFTQPTLSVFRNLDIMDDYFQSFLYHRDYHADKTENLDSNQLAITLPCNISKDKIKTTINRKTGMLTVSAEDNIEKVFSRNGWTGKTKSFSNFSKSIRLPKHVMKNEELMQQVTAEIKADQLKITFPEPKKTSENDNEESSELLNIETVHE